MLDSNGNGMHHEDDDNLFTHSDPVLPDPSQMGAHDGILLHEWRRSGAPLLLLSPRSIDPARSILFDAAFVSSNFVGDRMGYGEPTGCGASLSPSMTRFGISTCFNATSSVVSKAAAAVGRRPCGAADRACRVRRVGASQP
ncbi:hypothetical protein ZWY2020_052539 [Hordeum vulgare]|nr:hypothetical protein ZWY2020_052539 [Hordeum vulgare]